MYAQLKRLLTSAADGASYIELLLLVLLCGIVLAVVVPIVQG